MKLKSIFCALAITAAAFCTPANAQPPATAQEKARMQTDIQSGTVPRSITFQFDNAEWALQYVLNYYHAGGDLDLLELGKIEGSYEEFDQKKFADSFWVDLKKINRKDTKRMKDLKRAYLSALLLYMYRKEIAYEQADREKERNQTKGN